MNFANMMNNPMYRNMMNNMNPDMMRNACSNMDNMSDDQIRTMMAASGMGGMDVNTFRQMSKQMANSSPEDLNRMKNTAQNYTNNNPSTSNTQKTTNTTSSSSKTNSKSTDDILNDTFKSELSKLEKLKEKGNDFFRKQQYNEAKEKYFELLNQMNGMSNDPSSQEGKAIQKLKITCRLNISNCYLKMEDYGMVILECNKVLKLDNENFKACYRSGMAYYHKNDNAKALEFLEKAESLASSEEERNVVLDYQKKLAEKTVKNQQKSQENIAQKEDNKTTIKDNQKEQMGNFKSENSQEEEKKESKPVKSGNTVNKILEKEISKEKENINHENEDNIVIENEKHETSKKENVCSHHKNASSPSYGGAFDQKTIEESKKKFENMVRKMLYFLG